MDERGHPKVPARGVERLQPLQGHVADIADDADCLDHDMMGSPPDAFQKRRQRVALLDLDRSHHMLGLDPGEQRRVKLRHREHGHAQTRRLEAYLGAHQKPATGAVQAGNPTSVDFDLRDAVSVDRAQLRIEHGSVPRGPRSAGR